MKLQKFNIGLQVLTSLAGAFAAVMVILGFTAGKAGAEYSLMLSFAIIPFAFAPNLIEKISKWKMPEFIKTYFFVYMICAMVLGEVFNFYYIIPFWDKILHTASGGLFVISGLLILEQISKKTEIKMNDTIKLVFAFCFTLALGVIWEFVEFGFDMAIGTNMQCFATSDGTQLVGQAAIFDTMMDLVVSTVGAAITCFAMGFSKQKQKAFVPKMVKLPATDDFATQRSFVA